MKSLVQIQDDAIAILTMLVSSQGDDDVQECFDNMQGVDQWSTVISVHSMLQLSTDMNTLFWGHKPCRSFTNKRLHVLLSDQQHPASKMIYLYPSFHRQPFRPSGIF